MTTLTFGKYSGQSIESLKRIDPDYLRWGAQNLRSDKWRAEFTEVAATITMEDEAWAIVHESPDIDYYEALRHLRDEAVEREEEERIRQ